ncbi:MAG: AraC family transcriptional regulator [Verrucomicrobiae bacterium]|nr:AraC family transcriptional regulator [Verrucomicrobiae bacterium]
MSQNVRLKGNHIVPRQLQKELPGMVTMAGTLRKSPGVPRTPLRILGAYALVYLVNGPGYYADQTGFRRAVGRGDMIFLSPDLAHTYGPDASNRWDEIFIVFEGPIFDLWQKKSLFQAFHPVCHLEPVDYWLSRIDSVMDWKLTNDAGGLLQETCRLQMLLAEMSQSVRRTARSDPGRDWVTRAMAWLEETPGDSASVESVARRVGLSYETFRKRFTRETGTPPTRFCEAKRIQRAAEVLVAENLSNKQMAERFGFCDEFHFSKRFKEFIGMTPRQFRSRRPFAR